MEALGKAGYALNEKEAAAALPAYVDPFAPAKEMVVEEEMVSGGGDISAEEVRFHEDVVEVEAETTMERAARFA